MSPEQFSSNLKIAVQKTLIDIEPTMQQAALSAKAMLTRRVQSSGFGKRYTSRGYIRLRQKKGYEIKFVNLTFSEAMFQGWKRPGTLRQGLKITGTVGGVDRATIDKLRWNKSRYPSFDQLNDEERNIIVENLVKPQVLAALKKNLFNS